MSCIPFDIQKSNWLLQNYPMRKLVKHAILFFSTNWRNISLKKTSFGQNCEHRCFIHRLSTNCMDRWFLKINKPISLKNNFGYIWSFWKRFLATKTINKCSTRWIWFFLHVVFPLFFTINYLLPPWIFSNNKMVCIYFFQCCYSTCCIIYDYIFFARDLRLQNKIALM